MLFYKIFEFIGYKFHPVRLFERAKSSYIEFHAVAEFKIRFMSLIGTIGFPLYYFIWTHLFPQQYESIVLRCIGFVLSFIIFVSPFWPKRLRRYRILYSYVAMLYGVPFFFSAMLLMNEASIAWQLSAMSGLLFVVFMYDTINLVIATVIGAAMGYLFYVSQTGVFEVPPGMLTALPILGFTFLGIVFLNYSDDVISKAKLNAAATLASHIAHEMRTPLLGIQLEAEKVSKYIPKFTDCYAWAVQKGWPGGRISSSQIDGFNGSMKRIKDHSSSANLMIDMLLMNVRSEDISAEEFSICSAKETIDKAIERYHFRTGEKLLITIDVEEDFEYWGTEVLMVHVLFNLMRNSFRAIHAKGRGQITIKLQSGQNTNSLIFRDTGQGMPAEIINYIFIPFFSGSQGSGAGVGLSFSRQVIERFGGTIICNSILERGTEFVITLPKIHSATVPLRLPAPPAAPT
ncbi:MAG: sensor histidine kinase [Methyloligellaceae bacterium]